MLKKIMIVTLTLILGGILAAENVKATMVTNYGNIELELYQDLTPMTVDNFVGLASGNKEWKDPETGESRKDPFYNGLIFHRVIADFMIQGGCPLGTGTGGPGYRFDDEFPGESIEISGQITTEEDAYLVYEKVIIPHLRTNQVPNSEIKEVQDQCVKAQSLAPVMEHSVEYFLEKAGMQGPLVKNDLTLTVDYGTICMANSGPNTNGSQFFIVTKQDGANWLNGKHTVFGKVTSGMDVVHMIENLQKDGRDKPLEDVKAVIEQVIIHE